MFALRCPCTKLRIHLIPNNLIRRFHRPLQGARVAENAAGRDSARPLDAQLPPSSPRAGTAYRAHEVAAHLKQALRGSGVAVPASKGAGTGPGPSAATAAAAAGKEE